jgi:glycerol-3-phosphate dehydrogenase
MKLERKRRQLETKIKKTNPSVSVSLYHDCFKLTGEVSSYSEKLALGNLATKYPSQGVLNDLTVKGLKKEEIHHLETKDTSLEGKHVDVLVIGGGVVGSAILRELTKYNVSALLVEKEEDVAMEASSHNDGCLHVGLDLHKGSQKLKYLLRARELLPSLTKDIGIETSLDGQSVAIKEKWLKLAAPFIKLKAKINHVPGGVKILNKKQMKALEPNLANDVSWGVYLPAGGSISPYLFTIALAESALINKAEISLRTLVTGMEKEGSAITKVFTTRGTIYPKLVINAAGTYADNIAEMADDRTFSIHPRKGTDIIMDKAVYSSLSKTGITFLDIKGMIGSHSKGGGIIPTIDRNSLVGPDAVESPYKEDFAIPRASIDKIFAKQKKGISSLSERDIIAYFSGERAATYEEDFVVRKGLYCSNIIEAAGIQSPGLTAAPAIAEDCAKWAATYLKAGKNPSFNPLRKAPVETRKLTDEARDALIKKDPHYGHIVCRCEEISEGEILDAIHGILPATTIDGVKRRVRAGMGRCQGGFCQPLVASLIAQENHESIETIVKKGEGKILLHPTKGEER